MTPTGLTYDPEPARQRIKELRAAGIGIRRIAKLADAPYCTIQRLVYGHQGRPVLYLRPDITARILEISPTDHAPNALVDATAAHRRLQALIAAGWTQKSLAERLGSSFDRNFPTLLRQPVIRAAKNRAIEALYDELTSARFGLPPTPDESTPQKRGEAEKARKMARTRGWPPPAAWDDETIGDPAARPADGWKPAATKRWRSANLVDAVEELARREGLDRVLAAERLGVTRDAIEAAYRRVRAKAAQEQGTGSRFDAAA